MLTISSQPFFWRATFYNSNFLAWMVCVLTTGNAIRCSFVVHAFFFEVDIL